MPNKYDEKDTTGQCDEKINGSNKCDAKVTMPSESDDKISLPSLSAKKNQYAQLV